MFRLLCRKPVGTPVFNACGTTTITKAGYVTMVAKMANNCEAIQVYNGSTSTIKLAVGAAGHEVDLPFYIGPGISDIIPFDNQIKAGARLSAEAVDADASAGSFIVNFFAG